MANPISDQAASEGTAFSFQFAVNAFSDPDGDPLTYAATLVGGGSLPTWLTFTPSTRTFSGIPGASDFADLNIRVTATDPGGLSAHDDFLMAVNGKPVVANPIPDQQAAYNVAFSFQFASNTFTDPDGDPLTYSADLANGNPLPSWLTFTPATRTFSGMPALADLGTLQVRVTASDGSLQATNAFSLQAVFVPANDSLASCFIDMFCSASLFDDGSGSYTGALNDAPAPATGRWRIQSVTDRIQGLVFTAPSVAERVTWNHVTKRFESDGNRKLQRNVTGTPQNIFPDSDYTVFMDVIRDTVAAGGSSYFYNFGANDLDHRNLLVSLPSSTMQFEPRSNNNGGQDNFLNTSGWAADTRYLFEGWVSGLNSRMLRDATVVASKSDNDSQFSISNTVFALFGRNVTDAGHYMAGSSAGIWCFSGAVTPTFEAVFRVWVAGTFPDAIDIAGEWRFDDGAGQVLTDYSGHGYHGRLGSTTGSDANDPAWVAEGLSFDGSNDYVVLPSLPAVHGIDVVFKPNAIINAASSATALLANIRDSGVYLGSSTSALTNEIICLIQQTADGYSGVHRAAWTHASDSISAGWHMLQMDRRPGATEKWNILLDGVAKQNAVAVIPQQMLAGVWAIGSRAASGLGTSPYAGRVAYLILYGSKRTDQQQADSRAALAAILFGRGITLP